MIKARARYAAYAVLTIFAGIGVHFHGAPLGYVVRDMIGDALWAMMMYWIVGVFAPAARATTRACVAFAISAAVEVSQLVHSARLDAIRHTMVGHLVLGTGFDARDFLAYSVGVGVALMLDRRMKASEP